MNGYRGHVWCRPLGRKSEAAWARRGKDELSDRRFASLSQDLDRRRIEQESKSDITIGDA
jgi:hypothetical protein